MGPGRGGPLPLVGLSGVKLTFHLWLKRVLDPLGSRVHDVTVEINLERPTSTGIEEKWMNLLLISDLQGVALMD